MCRCLPLTVLLVSTLASCAPAESEGDGGPTTDEAAVLSAVEQFFHTMTARDPAGARAVLDPTGSFVSVRWEAEGTQVAQRASAEDYLGGLATGSDAYLERMWDAEVRIHGPIATVWTPYDFYVDGAFSHCGVDAFQLLRTDDGWVITAATYTVERTRCPESPLGPPEM